MLRKLIVLAITSGLASKAYRALMNRQRATASVRSGNVAANAPTRPGQPTSGARAPNR